mmetsp:Transcript_41328/g.81516  ORF Transcript_41328/g.81516 Transcript_41328/m.81516 type:complete len:150 (-) Transcript_41328:1348-1797(-)
MNKGSVASFVFPMDGCMDRWMDGVRMEGRSQWTDARMHDPCMNQQADRVRRTEGDGEAREDTTKGGIHAGQRTKKKVHRSHRNAASIQTAPAFRLRSEFTCQQRERERESLEEEKSNGRDIGRGRSALKDRPIVRGPAVLCKGGDHALT